MNTLQTPSKRNYKICVAMPLYGASESAGIPKATLACLWYLGDHINSIIMGDRDWQGGEISLDPDLYTDNIEHGRNNLVRLFLEKDYTHLLSWDSDQVGQPKQIGKIIGRMLRADLPIISVPTVAKCHYWKQGAKSVREYLLDHGIPSEERLAELLKGAMHRVVPDFGLYKDRIKWKGPGLLENDFVSFDEPNFAFSLIKRKVLEDMWNFYGETCSYRMSRTATPDVPEINERHVGLFHTMIRNHVFRSEDMSFADRWRNIGGKAYLYIGEGAPIGHVGHTTFEGTREGMLADWSENYPRFEK